MANARRALQVVTGGFVLGTSFSVAQKDREYFRNVAKGAFCVSASNLLVGGTWSYIRNNPFFSKYVLLNTVALGAGTLVFFTMRGYLERRKTTQYVLPERDRMFYPHVVSIAAATATATFAFSVMTSDCLLALRAGLLAGLVGGFLGHSAYEILAWWGEDKYRKIAIQLHFPYVWKELQKSESDKWIVGTGPATGDTSNVYILNLLKEFYFVITGAKAQVLEAELQAVEFQLSLYKQKIAALDMATRKQSPASFLQAFRKE